MCRYRKSKQNSPVPVNTHFLLQRTRISVSSAVVNSTIDSVFQYLVEGVKHTAYTLTFETSVTGNRRQEK
jgi:hypothetical protein